MFNSLGWPEIGVLLLVALFVFGPDRLPGIARDAASAVRKVREAVTGAKSQLREEFGGDFAGLDLSDLATLNPREFVRRQLLDDEPPSLIKRPSAATPRPSAATPRPAPPRPAPVLRADGDPPPYDPDTT